MAATVGRDSASAASALTSSEASELIATARGLPLDWCVRVRPPHGQLAIEPLEGMPRDHLCWIASPRLGRLTRQSWRPLT